MRERVEVLGGAFELISGIGKGTTIRALLPLAPGEEDV
jgi:signal transduction histidine kinase